MIYTNIIWKGENNENSRFSLWYHIRYDYKQNGENINLKEINFTRFEKMKKRLYAASFICMLI